MKTPSFLWIASQVCKAFSGSVLRCPSSLTLGSTPFIFPFGNLQVFEQINSHFAFLWGPQIMQHVCLHSSLLSLWVLGWFPCALYAFTISVLLLKDCFSLGQADNPGHKAYQPYENILRCPIASTAFPMCSVASASPAVVKFPCTLTTVSAWQRLEITLTARSSTELLIGPSIGPSTLVPPSFLSQNIYIYIYPRFDFCCL